MPQISKHCKIKWIIGFCYGNEWGTMEKVVKTINILVDKELVAQV